MRQRDGMGEAEASYRAVGGAGAPLTFAEVQQLWCFLDTPGMDLHTRGRFRRSWGFCRRHTWAHAVVKCELCRQLLTTAILHQDLTGRAARALSRPGPAALACRRLRPRVSCLICDGLTIPTASGDDPFSVERWRRANRLEGIRSQLAASRAAWLPRSCPICAGGDGPTCRPHLLVGAANLSRRRKLAGDLAGLHSRLGVLVESMDRHGPARTPEVEAAWVEALGWFAGWEFPIRLSVQPGAGADPL
jgi:hypothetical protein